MRLLPVANVAQRFVSPLRKFPWDFWNWFDAGMVALWVLSETWFQVWGPSLDLSLHGCPFCFHKLHKLPRKGRDVDLPPLPFFFFLFFFGGRCLTTCPRLTNGREKNATAFDALAQSMDERIIRLARTARLFRTLVTIVPLHRGPSCSVTCVEEST